MWHKRIDWKLEDFVSSLDSYHKVCDLCTSVYLLERISHIASGYESTCYTAAFLILTSSGYTEI